MQVKGILVEGKDGKHYLLGIGPRDTGTTRPTIWRYDDGKSVSLEETREGSKTIREQLQLSKHLQPGETHDEHVKWAVLEAVDVFLKEFFGRARW